MSSTTLNLTPEVYDYLQKMSLREHPVLTALRKQTMKMSMSQMQISPEQGQFMALLIELLGAKKTLDIGTFTGYSALAVALALPKDGKVIACDINGEWTKVANKYWTEAEVAYKIELRLQPAVDTLDALIKSEPGTFDFSFIDADKANYPEYYEKSFQLVRKGGLIAIDNVLWDGKVADLAVQDENTKTIRALNEMILKDDRVSLSMIPIGDGLTLVRKR